MRVLMSGTWRTVDEIVAILNHPGHSSQKSHGRRGGGGEPGSGRDISRDHEKLGEIYRESVDENGQWAQSSDGDRALIGLAREQGFDAKPTVMDSEAFDRAVAESGHQVMYRGINPDSFWGEGRWGDERPSGADVHAETREGNYRPGYGVFGNGFYFATERAKAESFADGQPGSVGRYALDSGARKITFTDLRAEFGKYYGSNYKSDPVGTQAISTDLGRFAASRGYDAIHVPAGTTMMGGGKVQREEWVVLNRGALIADGGP